jgi:hypothetical protein
MLIKYRFDETAYPLQYLSFEQVVLFEAYAITLLLQMLRVPMQCRFIERLKRVQHVLRGLFRRDRSKPHHRQTPYTAIYIDIFARNKNKIDILSKTVNLNVHFPIQG